MPKTWAEFMANNEKIKAAGKVAVIQSFGVGSTWTSQLFVLGDYFNVQAAVPNFAADYTAGKAKYAAIPAAMTGLPVRRGRLQGRLPQRGLRRRHVRGCGRHGRHRRGRSLPDAERSRSATIQTLSPENCQAMSASSPSRATTPAKNGLTVWTPAGIYISKTSQHPEEAKKFVAYRRLAPPAATLAARPMVGAAGPYLVKGCTLPTDVPRGRWPTCCRTSSRTALTSPALEFVSPIKGPTLEQITVEVGSGIRSAAEAAALYDEDVKKQAHAARPSRLESDLTHGPRPGIARARVISEGEWPLTVAVAAAPPAVAPGPAWNAQITSAYPTWFYLPAAIIYGVLFLFPTFASLFFSLTRWTLFEAQFIGLENFVQFFREPFLVKGLVNTLIYGVVTSGAQSCARHVAGAAAHLRHHRPRLSARRSLLPGARSRPSASASPSPS